MGIVHKVNVIHLAEMREIVKKSGKILFCFAMVAALVLSSLFLWRDNENSISAAAKEETVKKINSTLEKKMGAKEKSQIKVAIDAGHQLHANSATEPVGPGAKTKKAKVSGGAVGVATKTPEYKLNLQVAKKLKKILLEKGYQVYMVRTSNNVNISNKQRAVRANKSGADIYIRIHADSSASSSVRGASMLYPSQKNPYVKSLSKPSKKLSDCILKSYCKTTGIKSRGLFTRDDLTGTNWSKIPVTLIEMGFLSNSTEDRYMQKDANQKKMAAGIAEGIDDYFGF